MSIPTAQEILDKHKIDYENITVVNSVEAMIEFAKLHLQAQREAILTKAMAEIIETEWAKYATINKQSILNAYPDDMIK